MSSGTGIKIVAVLTIAALFGSAAIREQAVVSTPDFGDVGRAVSTVVILAWIYDKWLWRWLPIPGRPPRLYGTWKMLLTPKEGRKGAPMEAKPAYLCVSQTALTIDATILFADGKSEATTASLEHGRQTPRLHLFYDYVPDAPSDSDPRRQGAASADVTSSGLDGKYWNDAQTWGFLKSDGRTKKGYDSFPTAAKHRNYSKLI